MPDFQEQALYFEAMFQAVSEEPWGTGITIGIMNWSNQFGRPLEGLYFDQTLQGSSRSKPAEGVAALWFGGPG